MKNMIKGNIRKKAEEWLGRYMTLINLATRVSRCSQYILGVKDGINNTAILAYMNGGNEALNMLVRKVSYDSIPDPDSDIIAISGKDKKVRIVHVDENRNGVDCNGESVSPSEFGHFIDIKDLIGLCSNDKKDNDNENEN